MIDENFFEKAQFRFFTGGKSTCSRDWGESDSRYGHHKFYYVIEGEGSISIDGKKFIPEPGEMFLIPANTIHSYGHNPNRPLKIYWCHFGLKLLPGKKIIYTPQTLKSRPSIIEIPKLFNSLLGTSADSSPLRRLYEQNVLMQLFTLFLKALDSTELLHDDPESLLNKVDQYISEHYQETIRSTDLAEYISMNKINFMSSFRKQYKITPTDHINLRRLQYIIDMIREEPDVPLETIASRVGYKYQNFLIQFKKMYGILPSIFRTL